MSEPEAALRSKGYGTVGADGSILNLDNYWRQKNDTAPDRWQRFIGSLEISSIPAFWQNGQKIPLEAYFQSQDRGAFSPFPSNMFSIEGLATTLILMKMIRERPDDFKALAIKYLDSCARIVEAVEDSCHTHWLTALNNQHIAAGVAHRIGLLDDGSYLKIIEHYRHVFDSMYEKALIGEGLQVFVQGAKTVGKAVSGLDALGGVSGLKSLMAP